MTIPLDFIPARPPDRAIRLVSRQVEERGVVEVVIGLPRHLNGAEGESARFVREFSQQLARKIPQVRLCLVDERRSTLSAKSMLHEGGVREREQRSKIDSVAAQVILEHALELERATGLPPGEEVVAEGSSRSGTSE